MDNPLISPNMPNPAERGAASAPGAGAESLQGAGALPEAPKPGEVVAPGGQPAGQASVPAAQPKLSPADVAAAIAATPVVGAAPVASQNPVTAADVDVIEPEWVDKAEAVVRQHQGDPYAEEEAIEELQQDYLKKRYGLNVGDPDTKSSGT